MNAEKAFKDRANKRQQYSHQGKVIYEWIQTLDELQIFIKLPSPNVKKNDLVIKIMPKRIVVGLKDNPPYLDTELWSSVDTSESIWYIDGDEICIECGKAKKGETWTGCFLGHGTLDPFLQQEIQKNLMLERFQEEHPGFDFSNASFSGNAPDPRTFMGGIHHK